MIGASLPSPEVWFPTLTLLIGAGASELSSRARDRREERGRAWQARRADFLELQATANELTMALGIAAVSMHEPGATVDLREAVAASSARTRVASVAARIGDETLIASALALDDPVHALLTEPTSEQAAEQVGRICASIHHRVGELIRAAEPLSTEET